MAGVSEQGGYKNHSQEAQGKDNCGTALCSGDELVNQTDHASLDSKPGQAQFIYTAKPHMCYIGQKKPDFSQGVACVITTHEVSAQKEDFEVWLGSQLKIECPMDKREELISRFICIRSTQEQLDTAVTRDKISIKLAIPMRMPRTSFLHRQPVIKAKVGGLWHYFECQEFSIEEYKELKLVESTFDVCPEVVCVVSRFRKDTFKVPSKSAMRFSSTVDQRLSIKIDKGAIKKNPIISLQIQPIDASVLKQLHASSPDLNSSYIMCSSSIINMDWATDTFLKPVIMYLPIPLNPVKAKKAAAKLASSHGVSSGIPSDPSRTRKPEDLSSDGTKWYMGVYGEEEEDSIYVFDYDPLTESWSFLSDSQPKEIRKDLLKIILHKPSTRLIALRCRTFLKPEEARLQLKYLEEASIQHPVRVILSQNPYSPWNVTVHCLTASKFEEIFSEMTQHTKILYGDLGPPRSKELLMKEGQLLMLSFCGNVELNTQSKKEEPVQFYFHSQLLSFTEFEVKEVNRHLQKNYDYYKGICLISNRIPSIEIQLKNFNGGESTNGIGPGKFALHKAPLIEPSRAVCQLSIQLEKEEVCQPSRKRHRAKEDIDNCHPVHSEVMAMLVDKLGKEWELLAEGLQLPKGRVQAIKARNRDNDGLEDETEMKRDMFITWCKRIPRCTNRLPLLYSSLLNCGRIDLAYKVEDLYCGLGQLK